MYFFFIANYALKEIIEDEKNIITEIKNLKINDFRKRPFIFEEFNNQKGKYYQKNYLINQDVLCQLGEDIRKFTGCFFPTKKQYKDFLNFVRNKWKDKNYDQNNLLWACLLDFNPKVISLQPKYLSKLNKKQVVFLLKNVSKYTNFRRYNIQRFKD